MEIKTERKVAYFIAIIFFFIGVICYAAFPVKKPENPVRVMLTSTAGNVLFDHKEHASEDGYAIECLECHHTMEEGDTPEACGECHEAEEEDGILKKSDAFHMKCKGCHEDEGSGPLKCAECHAM